LTAVHICLEIEQFLPARKPVLDIDKEVETYLSSGYDYFDAARGLPMESTSEQKVERIKTFIEGLDERLGGGIKKGHVVLLAGTPGSMKSSVALNILYNNAYMKGTKVLYISIEESRESLMVAMKNLGMTDIDSSNIFIVDIGRLRLEHTDADIGRDWFRILKEYLRKKVEVEGIEMLVIDSLTAIYSLTTLDRPRQELFHFFGFLKRLGVTSFIISETEVEGKSFGPYHEDFLADGTIQLKFVDVGESDVQLRMRIVKMRHSKIHHGYLTLLFREGQFTVTPPISE